MGEREPMLDKTTHFDRFWSVYPKRAGSAAKAMARVKFTKLMKEGVDPEIVIAGARRYAEDNRAKVGTEFICMAQTWLHQRRFEDYGPTEPTIAPEEAERLIAQYHRRQEKANGRGS